MNLLLDKESVFENIDEVVDKYLRPQKMNIDGIEIEEGKNSR
jgi:hypothetical protein